MGTDLKYKAYRQKRQTQADELKAAAANGSTSASSDIKKTN